MRPPDQIIRPAGIDYLHRWRLFRKKKHPPFNIYLHRFLESDDDRALHDHPWWSISILLKGNIHEVIRDKDGRQYENHGIRRFIPKLRSANYAHRVVLETDEAWTLFIVGPKVREWGFLCPQGWRHWKVFTTPDGSGIGRGCE